MKHNSEIRLCTLVYLYLAKKATLGWLKLILNSKNFYMLMVLVLSDVLSADSPKIEGNQPLRAK